MDYKFEILEQKKVYQGFLQVTQFTVNFEYFTGEMSGPIIRESLGKGNVVAALVFDKVKDVFVFVEQFRVGMMVANKQPWNLEIVAGIMDKPNETPEQTMIRELYEEIGTQVSAIHLMCEYYASPGSSASKNYIYAAEVDSERVKSYTGIHEEGEDIAVRIVSRKEMLARLRAGEIDNSMMLIALQHFALNQNQFI